MSLYYDIRNKMENRIGTIRNELLVIDNKINVLNELGQIADRDLLDKRIRLFGQLAVIENFIDAA